jgi:hypothetical protein
VSTDAFVAWQGSRYSVPWKLASERVQSAESHLLPTRQCPLRAGSIILTSNKSYADWGSIFGDPIIATAILDRLLHHSTTVNIRGESYRSKEHRRAGLLSRPKDQQQTEAGSDLSADCAASNSGLRPARPALRNASKPCSRYCRCH